MITMLRRIRGSPHGHDDFWYEKGVAYGSDSDPPMTDSLRQTFLDEGWAVEEKSLGAAPENKMLDGSPSNKSTGEPGPMRRRRARKRPPVHKGK